MRPEFNLLAGSSKFALNPAIGNFRRRIQILQTIGNEADSVKLPIPKGEKLNNHRLKTVGLNEGLKVRIRVKDPL